MKVVQFTFLLLGLSGCGKPDKLSNVFSGKYECVDTVLETTFNSATSKLDSVNYSYSNFKLIEFDIDTVYSAYSTDKNFNQKDFLFKVSVNANKIIEYPYYPYCASGEFTPQTLMYNKIETINMFKKKYIKCNCNKIN